VVLVFGVHANVPLANSCMDAWHSYYHFYYCLTAKLCNFVALVSNEIRFSPVWKEKAEVEDVKH